MPAGKHYRQIFLSIKRDLQKRPTDLALVHALQLGADACASAPAVMRAVQPGSKRIEMVSRRIAGPSILLPLCNYIYIAEVSITAAEVSGGDPQDGPISSNFVRRLIPCTFPELKS
jgi:hypothetical protein